MERIGERLRKRREELGFTIDDIARVTRFRPETVRAVEEGRVGVFPAEAYLNAFLRAYAGKLGMDAGEIVREQKSEEERVREAIKGIRLRPHGKGNLRRTIMWLAVVAIAVIAVLLLFDQVLKDRYMADKAADTSREGSATRRDSLDEQAGSGSESGDPGSAEISTGDEGHSSGDVNATEEEISSPEVSTGDEGHSSRDASTTDEETVSPESSTPGEEAISHDDNDRDHTVILPELPARGDASAPGDGTMSTQSLSSLEVAVSDWPIKARFRSGDSVLIEGWLTPGYRDTFHGAGPFVIDYLTDRDAVSITLDGGPVDLPASRDKQISGFEIPSGH